MQGSKEGKARVLNESDHKAFLEHLSTKRHALRDTAIYLLTYRAGLRIGSVSGLEMADLVDSKGKLRKVVTLRSKITKGNKTNSAYLSHPELREALEKYLNSRPNYKCKSVFVSQKGTRFSPNSMSQLMLKNYNEAGLDGCSSHSGRRGFASSLIANGLDIVSLSKAMGHSNITTTQRYVEVDELRLLTMVGNT